MRAAVLFLVFGMVLVACGRGPDADVLDPYASSLVTALDEHRNTADIAAVTDAAAATGDERFVPYLVDLFRVETEDARLSAITDALVTLTGVRPTGRQREDYVAFGSWLLDRPDVVPPETYPSWKARLYRELSDEFEVLINSLDPRTAAEVQWVGVPFDGIPAIDTPPLVGVAGAGYLAPTDLVFGTVMSGVARAYPLRILHVHEMSNDVLNGVPVVLANCTLCRSGVLYLRSVAGRELEFVTSGLLLNSNKLMVDLQTRTIWQQLTGTAIAGPLAGTQLERLFLTTTTWADWSAQHPNTLVLALPEQRTPVLALGDVSYAERDAHQSYHDSENLWFPAPSTTGGPPKVEILGVVHDDVALAIEVDALASDGLVVVNVGSDTISAIPTEQGGGRVFLGDIEDRAIDAMTETELVLDDGRRLPRIQAIPAYWFAWSSIHPDSERWP